MTTLYTIGYEGAALADFLNRLIEAGVATVIDVRELPLSRRKGFSKNPLKDALAARGISYVHRREFGAPKPIRNELRETGDYKEYFRQFNAYLKTQKDALRQLVTDYAGHKVALMCFEANPTECHRSAVARELGKLAEVVPVHLQVRGGAHDGQLSKTPSLHTGQGVPTA